MKLTPIQNADSAGKNRQKFPSLILKKYFIFKYTYILLENIK